MPTHSARACCRLVLTAIAALAMTSAGAQSPTLLVSSRFSDQILGYDQNGAFTGVFARGGGLDNPVGLTFGPDGHLWVASGNTNQVLRFDGQTGAPLGVFANVTAPRQLQFGPDGNLYVCSGSTASVLRFRPDGTTLGVFVQGSVIGGNTSMTFGPDLHLYVGSVFNNHVVRFDGRTGALLGVFANTGMNGTHDLSFGPDGHLWVSNAFGNNVVRFDGRTGAFLGVIVADPLLQAPLGLQWDDRGDLWVCNQGRDEVRRYDGRTGSLQQVVVASAAGGLDGPLFFAFTRTRHGPQLPAPVPAVAGSTSWFAPHGLPAGSATVLGAGTMAGLLPLPCGSLVASIGDAFILRVAAADEAGRSVFAVDVPASAAGFQFLFQIVDLTGCAVSPVLRQTF
ncbi:MAG: NHL repeat-containing protein [Planctomycetes bacterium]|nr:NHL repeat-containing protein [Planctomycetota bacterium]